MCAMLTVPCWRCMLACAGDGDDDGGGGSAYVGAAGCGKVI